MVLQYPSRRELIKELKKGYDYVGVSFIMAVMHKMKETVALIRKYAPNSKIVLGGYGTVLKDEVLKPYADYICREEGVAYFRRLLGEPEIPMPYKHPLIVSWLKVFGWKVSGTGKIFAGLGCPNGCDFCCTSHFFSRKHIKLLPTGRDIYNVVETIFRPRPEPGLPDSRRGFSAQQKARDGIPRVRFEGRQDGLPSSPSPASRPSANTQVEEILEMGIDGFWIGYEGTRSNYAKQQGRPVAEILTEFREHGITVLTSMIVGFDYQTPEIVAQELDGLMKLKPALGQYLIYGPVPGTPFHERVIKENLLQDVYTSDKDLFYRRADGFRTMIKHPTLSPEQIEDIQRWCFEQDFQRLGPSIYRVLESRFLGYLKLKDSPNPILRQKAEYYARELRYAYPVFLPGKWLGPNATIREWIGDLESRIHAELGRPALAQRWKSVMAVGAALWTGLTLKLDLFQHPKLQRTTYRLPEKSWSAFRFVGGIPDESADPEFFRPSRVAAREAAGLDAVGRRAFRQGRGRLGTAHPRFAGAQPEPAGAGPEQIALGQGGGPASVAGKARGLSLPHPGGAAQVVGGASRNVAAGRHVSPLPGLTERANSPGSALAQITAVTARIHPTPVRCAGRG